MVASLVCLEDAGARADAARETSGQIAALLAQISAFKVEGQTVSQTQLHTAAEQALALLGPVWPKLVEGLGGAERQAALLEQQSQLAADAAQLLKSVVEHVVWVPTTDAAVPGSCADSYEEGPLTAACCAAVVAAAQLTLGPGGAACCHHLSEQPGAGLNWLTAQQRVLEAMRRLSRGARSGAAGASLPQLLPLWLSLKVGTVREGRRNRPR